MNISRSRAPKPEDGCGSRERGLLAKIRATQIEYRRESRLGDATETKSGRRLNLTLTLELIAPTQPDTRTEDQGKITRKNGSRAAAAGPERAWKNTEQNFSARRGKRREAAQTRRACKIEPDQKRRRPRTRPAAARTLAPGKKIGKTTALREKTRDRATLAPPQK
jgi:hypothetical protein